VKQSLVDKLQQLVARSEELEALMSDPTIISDQNRFRDLSKEYAQLGPVVALFNRYQQLQADQAARRAGAMPESTPTSAASSSASSSPPRLHGKRQPR